MPLIPSNAPRISEPLAPRRVVGPLPERSVINVGDPALGRTIPVSVSPHFSVPPSHWGSTVTGTPNRMTMVFEDLPHDAPLRSMSAFLNPASLRQRTQAEWVAIGVPGLSHEVMQYSRTRSIELSFELYWNYEEACRRLLERQRDRKEVVPGSGGRLLDFRPGLSVDWLTYRDFLLSALYAPERGKAPPRVTITWPNVLSLTGAFRSVELEYKEFYQTGIAKVFTAQVEFVEVRTAFRNRSILNVSRLFEPASDNVGLHIEERTLREGLLRR